VPGPGPELDNIKTHFNNFHSGIQGSNTLSVAPISSGKYGNNHGFYATTSRSGGMGDYEDHRNFQQAGPTMTDYDDPYGRVMFQGRRPSHPGHQVSGHTVPHSAHRQMQHSLSHPRIQSHQGNSKLLYQIFFSFTQLFSVPNNHMYKVPSTLPPGSKV